MISSEQKRIVQSVIGVFETGRAGGGDPSTVAVLADHAGISYGIHQATDAGGGLDAIVLEYLDRGGRFAAQIAPYVPRLVADASAASPSAPWVLDLSRLLQQAGREDPVMLAAQQAVFDRLYWAPCASQCEAAGLVLPLSWAAVYDTCIQSGPGAVARMRARFAALPPSRGGVERAWTRAYLAARQAWLEAFVGRDDAHTAVVRRTTYRTRTLIALAQADRWTLEPPVPVRVGLSEVTVR